MGEQPPLLPDGWFGWMTVNSVGWVQVCVFAFAFRVHRKAMPRLAVRHRHAGAAGLACSRCRALAGAAPEHDAAAGLHRGRPADDGDRGVSGLWASWTQRARAKAWRCSPGSRCMVPVGVHDLLLQTYRIDIERIYLGAVHLDRPVHHLPGDRLAPLRGRHPRRRDGSTPALETQLAERELELTASHEQLRELERQQTLTAERQRLMQDMHDGIGSSLMSALRMVERGQASSGGHGPGPARLHRRPEAGHRFAGHRSMPTCWGCWRRCASGWRRG